MFRHWLAYALILFATRVSAQQPDTARTRHLDTLSSVTHGVDGIGTTDAASAGRVTSQMIDDRAVPRPGAVMEFVPGMVVTQHSGGGKANQYFLRGFNLDHGTDFQTTLGGMPINLPSHAHGQGYTDLNFLIPELVDRIDYSKGPYQAEQGDFATAGSASIRYADSVGPTRVDLPAGSHDYARAVVIGSYAVARSTLVYGLEASHVDGPWIKPDDYWKLNAVIRYVHPIDAGKWTITAMGYGGRWSATDQIPERAVLTGQLNRLGTVDTSDGGRSHRYSLSANFQKVIGAGVLQSAAYGISSYLDLYSNFTFFLNDPVHGDQIEQLDDRTVFGWNGSWIAPVRFVGREMTNTLGWDIRHDHVSPSGLYHTEDRARLATTLQDTVSETAAAIFAENRAEWTPWLRTVAGLRIETIAFGVGSNVTDNSGSGSGIVALPKVSVILGPWSKTEFFLNAGEGFHSNDIRGATGTIGAGAGIGHVTPIVRATGGEIGIRSERFPQLQSSLSLWYLGLASELVFDGDAGTTSAGRPSRRVGVEWSNRYAATRWLAMDFDVAMSRARFTDADPAGNHIPDALGATAAGGITIRPRGSWVASLSVRYFGPRSLVESDSVRSAATTLFNSQVDYVVSRKVRLRLDLFNLFNERSNDITYYYTSRLPGESAAGVADLHFHPVESRSIRIAVMSVL